MGFTLKRFPFQSAKHTIFFSLSMFQNKNACHFTLNSIMFYAFSHLFHLHFSHLIQPLLTVGVTLGIYEKIVSENRRKIGKSSKNSC